MLHYLAYDILYFMRLTQKELEYIKDSFDDTFKEGLLYLFGSRVDESAKGGDIDLFIKIDSRLNDKEIIKLIRKFKIALYDRIGEQKIDIVVSHLANEYIKNEVAKKGILLYEK